MVLVRAVEIVDISIFISSGMMRDGLCSVKAREIQIRSTLASLNQEIVTFVIVLSEEGRFWWLQNGHEDVVRLLLSTDIIGVNTKECNGWAPLSLALRNRHEGHI